MMKSAKYNFCHPSFLYNNIQSYKDKVLVIDTRDPELCSRYAISRSINISHNAVLDSIRCKRIKGPEVRDIALTDLPKLMVEREREKFEQRKRSYCVLIISENSLPKDFIMQIHKSTNPADLLDFFSLPYKTISDDFKKAVCDMHEKESVALGLRIFDLMHHDKVRELFILVDGANTFFNAYPFMNPAFHPSPHDFLRSPSLVASRLDVTFNFPNDIYSNRLFLGTFNQVGNGFILKNKMFRPRKKSL